MCSSDLVRVAVTAAVAGVIDVEMAAPRMRESIIADARARCDASLHATFDKLATSLDDRGLHQLKQPKLPEGTWEVTSWDAPSGFEWIQRSTGATIVAGHRVAALGEDRSRLTLSIEMRGLLAPVMGRVYRDLTNRYIRLEAETMKRDAESA